MVKSVSGRVSSKPRASASCQVSAGRHESNVPRAVAGNSTIKHVRITSRWPRAIAQPWNMSDRPCICWPDPYRRSSELVAIFDRTAEVLPMIDSRTWVFRMPNLFLVANLMWLLKSRIPWLPIWPHHSAVTRPIFWSSEPPRTSMDSKHPELLVRFYLLQCAVPRRPSFLLVAER